VLEQRCGLCDIACLGELLGVIDNALMNGKVLAGLGVRQVFEIEPPFIPSQIACATLARRFLVRLSMKVSTQPFEMPDNGILSTWA
jgi:hypothetical protein